MDDVVSYYCMEQTMIQDPPPKKMSYSVIKDDITKVRAEAVVTGEGERFSGESTVTQSLTVVMPQLGLIRSRIRDTGGLDLWTAHVSQLGSNSRFQYVVHAVLDKGNNKQWLRFMKNLYKNIFKETDRHRITSIVLPVLGSGASKSDKTLSIEAMVTSILTYSPSYLTEVKVVTKDQDLLDMVKAQFKLRESSGCESNNGIVSKLFTGFKDNFLPPSYFDVSKDNKQREDELLQKALKISEEQAATLMKKQEKEDKSQMALKQYTVNTSVTTGVQDKNVSMETLQQFDEKNVSANKYQHDCFQDVKIKECQPYLKLAAKHHQSSKEDTTDKTPESTFVKDIKLCNGEEDSHLQDLPTDNYSNLESSTDQENDANKANGNEHNPQENTSSEFDDREKDLSTIDNSKCKHLEDKEIDATSEDLKKTCTLENSVNCLGIAGDNDKAGDSKTDSITTCPICLSAIIKAKTLDKCGHVFCQDCIDQCFRDFKPVCPSCNMVYGVITGNQPEGNMDVGFRSQSLPDYEHHGTIIITYSFPSGIQKEGHPYPGKPYKGTTRRAYLPDCKEGRDILFLLRTAFDRKLTFTVGRSTTTGQENVVTWNDIHHKTNMGGGPTRFGYPDPTYLARVRDELVSKGVTTQ